MRVQLGRRGDYAIRAVVALARLERPRLGSSAPDPRVPTGAAPRRKTQAIAAEMSIPQNYLPQILSQLVAAGLVDSEAGPRGGYRLARPAAQVTLLEVIDAVEAVTGPAICILEGGPCEWSSECAVHRFWSAAQDAFRDRLAAVTFADIGAVDAMLTARQHTDLPDPGATDHPAIPGGS